VVKHREHCSFLVTHKCLNEDIRYWLYVRQNAESSSGSDLKQTDVKMFLCFIYVGYIPLVTLVPFDVILVFRIY
jgi:hypothetical protein